MFRTFTHTFRLLAEPRLLFKSPGKPGTNEDTDALEKLVNDEESKNAMRRTPKGAAAKMNGDRSDLMRKIDEATDKRFLDYIFRGRYQKNVTKRTDAAIDQVARSIVLDRNTGPLPGRLKQFFMGENYLPPVLLAKVMQTKAEISKSIAAEIRADVSPDSVNDPDELFERAKNALKKPGALNVRITSASRALLAGLQKVETVSVNKAQSLSPMQIPGFEKMQKKEDQLRAKLIKFGAISPGDKANDLFRSNREGTNSELLNLISNSKEIRAYMRPLLLLEAKNLRSGWFSKAANSQYDLVNTKIDALNLSSREQRLQFLKEGMTSDEVSAGRIAIKTNLRGLGAVKLSIIGREEKHVQMKARNSAGKEILAVLNTETGRIYPHGVTGPTDIGPVMTLSDGNFTLVA